MCAPVVVAMALAVGDQAMCRMCGAFTAEGRADSENMVGFCDLKAVEKSSFLRGRLRDGAGMVEVVDSRTGTAAALGPSTTFYRT